MKPEDQIKELAELDGLVYDNQSPYMSLVWRRGATYQQLPGYLTSYDAIIPLIQKQDEETQRLLARRLGCSAYRIPISVTPAQLCEALLRATGKWKE